jgi:hypothetical protein
VHVASQLTNYIPKIQTLHELRKGESEHSTHTHTHTHVFSNIAKPTQTLRPAKAQSSPYYPKIKTTTITIITIISSHHVNDMWPMVVEALHISC